eukprot:4378851-Alexandrium_andersonii.AAC.1
MNTTHAWRERRVPQKAGSASMVLGGAGTMEMILSTFVWSVVQYCVVLSCFWLEPPACGCLWPGGVGPMELGTNAGNGGNKRAKANHSLT